MGFWDRITGQKNAQHDYQTEEELLALIDKEKIPGHIAIIMDGNGRWAGKKGLLRAAGHRAGVESLRNIVKLCSSLGVQHLTVYGFSTENWKRPLEEVNILMDLLVEYLRKEILELHQNNVRVRAIGMIKELPAGAQEALSDAIKTTDNNTGLTLNLALNYGGRAEIVEAVRSICQEALQGRLDVADINEKAVSDFLFTAGVPDPDLIIRPSGELRISNFLLWQAAYSEFWYSSVLWPDFNRQTLLQAILDYQKRQRRFGGL